MGHVFNPAHMKKLDSPMRRKLLPPEETVAKLGIKAGSKVADIGCGIGYFTFPLAQAVGQAGTVLGLDVSPEMLQEARRRWLEEQGAPANVQFLLSHELQIPLPDQQLDTALMCTVLHEIPEPTQFLKEIKRILTSSGQVIILEWKKEVMEMGPPLEERLSMEQTSSLLESAGFSSFEVLEIGKAHYAVIARSENDEPTIS